MKAIILSTIIWLVSQTPTIINKIDYGYAQTKFGNTTYVSVKLQDFDFVAAVESQNVQLKWDFTKEFTDQVK